MPCHVLFGTFSSFWWAENVWEWDMLRIWSGVGPHNAPFSVTHYCVPQRLKSTCSQRFTSTTGSPSTQVTGDNTCTGDVVSQPTQGILRSPKSPLYSFQQTSVHNRTLTLFILVNSHCNWVRARRTHLLQTVVWTSAIACTLRLWKTGLKEIWLFDTFSADWF